MTSWIQVGRKRDRIILLCIALLLTAAVYWPGLSGGFIFDDYPNIVDNQALQIKHISIPDLTRAALSSPSSEFRRPLASLTFAANYLLTGLDPYWMKFTNVLIHLINGILVYLLTVQLLQLARREGVVTTPADTQAEYRTALCITAAWLLLPINLTAVLYVVQRMASLANIFVLLGLLCYVRARRRMLREGRGLFVAALSIILATAVGFLAKETAVLTPLYAALVEWALLRGQRNDGKRDWRIYGLFSVVLVLPLVGGLIWEIPKVVQPGSWAARDFTLPERLLSEARIVLDYIRWTVLPTPHALSFYHDGYVISTGWLTPWTTLPSIALIAGLLAFTVGIRKRAPLVALGLALFFGCQSLTATILPLELVYEHRNYFASYGLLLAVMPLLTASARRIAMPVARRVLLGGLMIVWAVQTASTSYAWGNTLRLSRTLADRAPDSPRAQYDLGRTYIILSHYNPSSPYTAAAYAPLERAMQLPHSSILPEQALIMMNARMNRPIRAQWWNKMIATLRSRDPGVQDASSLQTLTQCAREGKCGLPQARMVQAFSAALDHPQRNPRILATYADYAWNVLGNRPLALRMAVQAVQTAPTVTAYRITLVRMLTADGQRTQAKDAIRKLRNMNIGGRLDGVIAQLQAQLSTP